MVRAQLTTRAASTPPHLTVRPTPGHLQPKASTGRGDTVVPARLSTKEGTGHAMTEAIFTYLVIAEDGTSHEHHHRMADTDTIDDVVRAAVGGWLEEIRVADRTLALWCDEEGAQRRRPVNPVGSRLVLLLGGRAAAYVGPIVVTGVRAANTVSLTQDQLDQLLADLQALRPRRDATAGS